LCVCRATPFGSSRPHCFLPSPSYIFFLTASASVPRIPLAAGPGFAPYLPPALTSLFSLSSCALASPCAAWLLPLASACLVLLLTYAGPLPLPYLAFPRCVVPFSTLLQRYFIAVPLGASSTLSVSVVLSATFLPWRFVPPPSHLLPPLPAPPLRFPPVVFAVLPPHLVIRSLVATFFSALRGAFLASRGPGLGAFLGRRVRVLILLFCSLRFLVSFALGLLALFVPPLLVSQPFSSRSPPRSVSSPPFFPLFLLLPFFTAFFPAWFVLFFLPSLLCCALSSSLAFLFLPLLFAGATAHLRPGAGL